MSRTCGIDLTSNQRAEVLALLNRCIPDTEVWAYGSRVKFTAKPHSDLDLVVFASPEQVIAVYALREAFDVGYLPFRDELPEQFHDTIGMNRVVLRSGKTEPAQSSPET